MIEDVGDWTAWILTAVSLALATVLLGCVVVAAIRGDSSTKEP
jgi:hypothetical protein